MGLFKSGYRIIPYLFFTWLVLILVVSSIPGLPNPNIELGDRIFRSDYLIHWAEYTILSGLFILWRGGEKRKVPVKTSLMALGLGFLVAAFDETHQLWIPGRMFNPFDMVYNFLGVVSGILLAILYLKNFRKTKKAPAAPNH
jgi:VanZ family protein